MASAKTSSARTAAQSASSVREFTDADLKAFLPEGFSAEDFEAVGGLRPVVQPELMMDQPVVGWVVALLDMPPRKDGSEWRALLIDLTGNCSAKVGEETLVINAGKEILIPVSGSLKNNPEVLNAACDAKRVFLGMFRVVGQVDTGKVSPMWDIEAKLHKKTIARTGKYTLQQHNAVGVVESKPAPELGRGDITDANGKPAGSMVAEG